MNAIKSVERFIKTVVTGCKHKPGGGKKLQKYDKKGRYR